MCNSLISLCKQLLKTIIDISWIFSSYIILLLAFPLTVVLSDAVKWVNFINICQRVPSHISFIEPFNAAAYMNEEGLFIRISFKKMHSYFHSSYVHCWRHDHALSAELLNNYVSASYFCDTLLYSRLLHYYGSYTPLFGLTGSSYGHADGTVITGELLPSD